MKHGWDTGSNRVLNRNRTTCCHPAAKQSSSLLHHPLRLKDRFCGHSVNTVLSPLHPEYHRVSHSQRTKSNSQVQPSEAICFLSLGSQGFKISAWFLNSSIQNEMISWKRAEKRGSLSLPNAISPAVLRGKSNPFVPSLSPSKALSLMHLARDYKLQGQGFYPFCPSTSLAHRRSATSSCAANSYLILSSNWRQCMWSQSSRRRWSVQTDLDVGSLPV